MKKYALILIGIALLCGGLALATQLPVRAEAVIAEAPTPADEQKVVELGEFLFFDENLSINGTQSCAACHGPEVGYTGPDSAVNAAGAVYQGALPNHFGNRKPPAAAYAGASPDLHYDEEAQAWFGGMFWDGRATGARLGDPLAEQAQGPYLNPLEQAIANAQVLCTKVMNAEYAGLFEEAWGAGTLNCATPGNVTAVYEKIGRSVAAYERSGEVNPFSSRFDEFWNNALAASKDVTKIKCPSMGGGGGMGMCGAGSARDTDPYLWRNYRGLGLNDNELRGLAVFNDPNKGNCASCHSLTPPAGGDHPLFTDFGYDNIGVPKNPDNPFYKMPKAWNPDGKNWIDYGLGGYLKSAGEPAGVYGSEMGKFKVPTLRNVALKPSDDTVKAYGHNGFFKSLDDIVFFYHWRAMMDTGCMGGGCEGMQDRFPPPEVEQNRAILGRFPGMEVGYIVDFLKTLSDQ